MNSWKNGDKGSKVKAIIDQNFSKLDERLSALASQVSDRYARSFTSSDWTNGTIFIDYSEYRKSNPCVDLYIKNSEGYSLVYGGYEIKNSGIEIQSDLPYEGRVVIR